MRVRKVVVVGSHGQRDDHDSDCGDRGGAADTTAKSHLSSPPHMCAKTIFVSKGENAG